jgi:hypothetical protein
MSARRQRPGLVIWFFVIIGTATSLWWQRQNVTDWLRLVNYQAPSAIVQLASDDTLTPLARKILYVNHPLLLSSHATLDRYCSNSQEQTIVLGCYHGGQAGIYVFAVSDSTLQGVEQVTTAHEMLHAAYDRLSVAERQQVDGWLQDYYTNQLHDQRILKTIESYKKTEPNDVINEMHSIFGTEVASLPIPLEQYYKRYFANRAAVATFAANYQQVFTSREDQVHQYDAQLAALKDQITTRQNQLQQQQEALETALQVLHEDRTNDDPTTYNAQVSAYNKRVTDYNNALEGIKQTINDYNQLVAKRNALALETQKLQNELSGRLGSISQQ